MKSKTTHSKSGRIPFIPNEPRRVLYSVLVKNTSDDKLYNVDVFNYDYENQKSLFYESRISGVRYSEILRTLQVTDRGKSKVKSTLMIAFCDYHKFKRKQICSGFSYEDKLPSGDMINRDIRLYVNPFQNQDDRAETTDEYDLHGSCRLILPYLMPEAEVILNFYI